MACVAINSTSTAFTSPPVQEKIASMGSTFVGEIFANFIRDLNYRPETPISDDNISYQALQNEFAAYKTGSWFDALCRESATIAELSYPGHSDEVRIQIARFTWFLIYVDDLGQRFPEYLTDFQKRVLTQDATPEGTFLVSFRKHLTDYYRLYDPIPANCINLAAMDFLNGCLLEQMPEIRDMKLSDAARSWPYFLRNKTGSAQAYAFMLFPREKKLDMTTYIQVIDDITTYTNMVNDILSFYKEDLAGEKNNYVYNRAFVTGRPLKETLQDVVDEALEANRRINKVLESTSSDALLVWKQFVNGYLGFHFTLKRYRLDELNIIS